MLAGASLMPQLRSGQDEESIVEDKADGVA